MPRLLASFEEPLVPTISVTLLWLMFAADVPDVLAILAGVGA
jgi:hypothetical protein